MVKVDIRQPSLVILACCDLTTSPRALYDLRRGLYKSSQGRLHDGHVRIKHSLETGGPGGDVRAHSRRLFIYILSSPMVRQSSSADFKISMPFNRSFSSMTNGGLILILFSALTTISRRCRASVPTRSAVTLAGDSVGSIWRVQKRPRPVARMEAAGDCSAESLSRSTLPRRRERSGNFSSRITSTAVIAIAEPIGFAAKVELCLSVA